MAVPEPRACPFCGSMNTKAYADGSGTCGNCGRAFRGSAPVGALLAGETADVKRAAVREKSRWGLLGLLGGALGLLGIPGVFLLGALLHQQGIADYVSTVFNRPSGALACGGIALLAIGGWYAMWAGVLLWRGYSERAIHGVVSGVLVILAGLAAGVGLAGAVGIVGGVLALVGALLVVRESRAKESGETEPPAATT